MSIVCLLRQTMSQESESISPDDTILQRWERAIKNSHFQDFHNAFYSSYFVQRLQLHTIEAQRYFFVHHGLLFQNRYYEGLKRVLTEKVSSKPLHEVWINLIHVLPRDLAFLTYSYSFF